MPAAPQAEKRPERTVQHGVEIIDDYAWLKDARWQAVMRDPTLLDADIRAHLEAENAHTEATLAPLSAFREALVAEMRGRIKEDDSSVPARDGIYEYAVRYRDGGQHPVYYRLDGAGAETVLLDGDELAEGEAFFRLGDAEHSPNHRLFAYSFDTAGSEYYTIRVKDLQDGHLLDDQVDHSQGDITWDAVGASFFYTLLDDNHRPCKVMRHELGTAPENDQLVYEEADPGFFVSVSKTESGRFILINAHDHTTSEVHAIEAARPERAPRLLHPRIRDLEVDFTDQGDRWLIVTNADGAEDFKICQTPLDRPAKPNWKDLVRYRPGCLIRGLLAFRDWIVRLEREAGLPRIVVTDTGTGAEHVIAFDEPAYELGLMPGYEYGTRTLRFSYASMATPGRVFDYDMLTRERILRKEQEVPSGHDPAMYEVRRLEAPAPDGEGVPVSILMKRGTPLDGSAPLFLYGYGAYGLPMPAGFTTNRFSLVDRGFVYAIAHVRGGMEKGYRWYREGKLADKPNTFTDFVAVAEHLCAEGFAAPGRIAAHGGSAGGMLMGAIANLRPDLFAAILAEVPFVDVLNTMSDADLPLTP
ncbi:MAG: S9 family peptidase, partial [Rhodospirillales bacterium]